jgi:hypothetical protein
MGNVLGTDHDADVQRNTNIRAKPKELESDRAPFLLVNQLPNEYASAFSSAFLALYILLGCRGQAYSHD